MKFLKIVHLAARCLPVFLVGLMVLLSSSPVGAVGQDDDFQVRSLTRKSMAANKYANITFERGILSRGPLGHWLLGDQVLVMTDDSRVSSRDDALGLATLEEGSEAMVLGQLRHGQLVVHRVLMIGQDESIQRGTFNLRRVAAPLQKGNPLDSK